MKVGTDGVLVGAWAGLKPDDRHILDIGTGTGLIALMLAQRTEGFAPQTVPDGLSEACDPDAPRSPEPPYGPTCPAGTADRIGEAGPIGATTRIGTADRTDAADEPHEAADYTSDPVPATSDTFRGRATDTARQPAAPADIQRPDAEEDRQQPNPGIARQPTTAGRNQPATGPASRGVRITGIDIGDIAQACENAAASPWSDRVAFVRCPVQRFRPDRRYDLIVSNPPFFVDSLTSPDAGRTTARHTVELPFEELRDAVVRLLAEHGRFAVVLPLDEGRRFERICRGQLFVSRRTEVRTTPRKAPKRVLLEFVRQAPDREAATGELTIGTGAHETYTPEYRALTGEFYLKF